MLTDLARMELRQAAPGRPAAVAIGVFDGVHLGHQRLIAHLRTAAQAEGLASVVLTFFPSPVSVLRPDIRLSQITTLEERLRLLRGLGVDRVARLTFTSDLAQVSAHDFLVGMREELELRVLVGGADLALGRSREGNVDWLRAHGPDLGVRLEVVPFVTEDEHKTGSSRIREAVAAGDVKTAGRLLGRPYALHGPVIHGAHRGRTIGVPTANIRVTADLAVPAHGVYVTRSHVGGGSYPSVTNIGRRPTFDNGAASIETHILDFEGDLYEREMRIDLLDRLRGEVKFEGVEQLVEQIQRDIADARRYFAGHE